MSKVWIITGSGSGLGRAIAEAALKTGDRVVATARDTDQLTDLVARYGARVLAFQLDVTIEEEGRAAVQAAVETFGRLDVLQQRGVRRRASVRARSISRISEAGRDMPLRRCEPHARCPSGDMRQQRSGHIIQISSLGGRTAFPGNAAYFASKWAVGGFTECLALETSPFGVKVTALEPGAMRTNWGKRAHATREPLLPEYESSVGISTKQMRRTGAARVATPRRWRRSSSTWPTPRRCRRTSCLAVMPFGSLGRPSRLEPPPRTVGER